MAETSSNPGYSIQHLFPASDASHVAVILAQSTERYLLLITSHTSFTFTGEKENRKKEKKRKKKSFTFARWFIHDFWGYEVLLCDLHLPWIHVQGIPACHLYKLSLSNDAILFSVRVTIECVWFWWFGVVRMIVCCLLGSFPSKDWMITTPNKSRWCFLANFRISLDIMDINL